MYRRLPAGKGRVDPKGVVEAQMPARRRRYDFFSRPVSPMKIRFRRSFLHLIYIFWAGLDRRKRIFIRYGEPQAHGNSVVNKVLEFFLSLACPYPSGDPKSPFHSSEAKVLSPRAASYTMKTSMPCSPKNIVAATAALKASDAFCRGTDG